MARITVEDCIDKFPSRFELVLVASNRARKLHSGETPSVEKDNDKNTVIALREIADETQTATELKNSLIEEYQTVTISEDEDLDENNESDDNNLENDQNNQNTNTDLIEDDILSAEDKSLENSDIKAEDTNEEKVNDDSQLDEEVQDQNIQET